MRTLAEACVRMIVSLPAPMFVKTRVRVIALALVKVFAEKPAKAVAKVVVVPLVKIPVEIPV